MADSPECKRRKRVNENNSLVDNFMKWCQEVGLSLNEKVTVREDGSCHRFGMIATDKLDEGECAFKIPRNVLLEPNTSSIAHIITELNHFSENSTRHKWVALLVTLLYEYTNPNSKWRPYLDLIPTEDVLNQPIFWSEQERQYLNLIETKDDIDNDEECIEEGYNKHVIPFMKKHQKYFDPKTHTLQLYKRLAGFVMAYSFTDNGPDQASSKTAMVPMADILNHVSDNNAHLEFGDEFLCMVTTQPVEKGSEVFNTYGNLDNCNLLRCYGFIEECPNPYDEVEIPLNAFRDVLNTSDDLWQCKLSHLQEQDTGFFNWKSLLFGANGCLCEEETLWKYLQIIHEEDISHVKDNTLCKKDYKDNSHNNKDKNDVNTNSAKGNNKKSQDNERHLDSSADKKGTGNMNSIEEQLSELEDDWDSDKNDEQEGDEDESVRNSENYSGDDENEEYEWDSDSSTFDDRSEDLVTYGAASFTTGMETNAEQADTNKLLNFGSMKPAYTAPPVCGDISLQHRDAFIKYAQEVSDSS